MATPPTPIIHNDNNNGDTPENHDIRITPLIDNTNDDHGCIMTLFENVLSNDQARQLLAQLQKDLPWNVETDAFGPQGRATCYFADHECVFSYVGLRLAPVASSHALWPPELDQLRQRVQRVIHSTDDSSSTSSVSLTACLANLFADSHDHIPFHYDEVRAHGPSKTVATLSLGGPRLFCWRPRRRNDVSTNDDDPTIINNPTINNLWLPSGSILLMQGPTQDYYEHALPAAIDTAHISNTQEDDSPSSMHTTTTRISLTFRSIVPGYEDGRAIATDQCTTSSNTS